MSTTGRFIATVSTIGSYISFKVRVSGSIADQISGITAIAAIWAFDPKISIMSMVQTKEVADFMSGGASIGGTIDIHDNEVIVKGFYLRNPGVTAGILCVYIVDVECVGHIMLCSHFVILSFRQVIVLAIVDVVYFIAEGKGDIGFFKIRDHIIIKLIHDFLDIDPS